MKHFCSALVGSLLLLLCFPLLAKADIPPVLSVDSYHRTSKDEMTRVYITPQRIVTKYAGKENQLIKNEQLLLVKGNPVYALYGLKGVGAEEMPPVDSPLMDGAIAYHNRKGPHAILPYDWEQFLRFADRYFKPSRRQ